MRNREGALLTLLNQMSSLEGPIGTRFARQALERAGIVTSESSVSRLLRELDERGWTVPVGTKGRVLSAAGRERAREAAFSARASASLQRAVDIKDMRDLLDLLHARQVVESAIAASAAQSATPDQIDALRAHLAEHRSAVGSAAMSSQPGLMFHRCVASMTTNRMFNTLAGVVLAPQLNGVEAVLDIILGSKRQNETVIDEHQKILLGIESGNPMRAEAAMREHFDTMMRSAEKFIDGNELVFERLLVWMDNGQPGLRSGERLSDLTD